MKVKKVPVDTVAYLAVGVPGENRDAYIRRAERVLNQFGFATRNLDADDILAQADHIRGIREALANEQ